MNVGRGPARAGFGSTILLRVSPGSPRFVAARGVVRAGATCRRLYSASSLRRHEHLDRLALVHRPVAVGYAVEVDDAVEDPARLDPSLEDVGQQFLDVGAGRGGTAADADVVVERGLRRGELLVLRDADSADGAAGAGDFDRRQLRLLEADALEHGVDAVAAGQFFDALDGFVAAFAYDIGGSELARERNPVGVAAEEDDLFGSEPPGGDHAAESDRAVADDRDSLAGRDLGGDGRVMAGAHHV